MVETVVFLSSGLFLGWSLGANDAANIFGTAVGARMLKFGTAAALCSLFVILGSVISGAGASQTLGELGGIPVLPGAFVVACSAAVAVTLLTRAGLPISTSQAIVGAIVGWNFYAGVSTDYSLLSQIVSTWVFAPLLAFIIAVIFYWVVKNILERVGFHLFALDRYTRIALIVAVAFGAYSLGANNIANVMGVFLRANPFQEVQLGDLLTFTGTEQLFLLGGIAIAVGVITYSKRVLTTVGSSIFRLSPITAFVVVMASSTVLFLFASEGLRGWFLSVGLPYFPLVPVSQSQAVVGAIFGIGMVKGAHNVNFRLLRDIFLGWIATPLLAALISYFLLYFMENVFLQPVY